jgi:uncharacterized SAM-binding protein YcdF (DUF218 family)
VAATLYLFVFPREDHPRHADAVVVLSGSRNERLPEALELMRAHVAPVLVISDGRDPRWHKANRYCEGRGAFRTICFKPHPYSTWGEAETIGRMAARRGWRSIVVVTSTYHVFRARILFRRCVAGDVDAVGARPRLHDFVLGVIYEWPKLIYAETLGRSC